MSRDWTVCFRRNAAQYDITVKKNGEENTVDLSKLSTEGKQEVFDIVSKYI